MTPAGACGKWSFTARPARASWGNANDENLLCGGGL